MVKTIVSRNSLYTTMDTSELANGLYFIALKNSIQQPLKFIVAH